MDCQYSQNAINELEAFASGNSAKFYELEIPESFAVEVLGLDGELYKSRDHKYIRRVPVTGSDGKRGYRYYYKVTGGKGLGSHEEMVVGAKFRVSAKDGHEEGHLTVESIDGDNITIRHDETGKEHTLSKKALAEMLHRHHLEAIKTAHSKAKEAADAAEKHGTEKQKNITKERFVALQSKFDHVLDTKKTENKEDEIKDYVKYRKAQSAINEAEQAIELAAKSLKEESRNRKKLVDSAIALSKEADEKIGEYIKMLYDMGDDRKGPDAMALKDSRKNLDKAVRGLAKDLKESQAKKRDESKKNSSQNNAQKRLDDLQNRKNQGWIVSGNTYEFYNQIKDAGGIWNSVGREWLMPSLEATESIKSILREVEDKKKERKTAVLSEIDRRRQDGFVVRGNTYQHKDTIKSKGGLWDADKKVWLMPDEKSYSEINKIVNPEKENMKILASEQAEYEVAMAKKASASTLGDVDSLIGKIKETEWGLSELKKIGLDDVSSNSPEIKELTEGRAVAVKDALIELVRTNGKAIDNESKKKSIGTIRRSSGYSYDGPYIVGEVLSHPTHGIVVVESTSKRYYAEEGMSFGVGDESGYVYSAKVRAPTPQEAAEFENKKADAELARSQSKRIVSIGHHIMDNGNIPQSAEGVKPTGKVIFDSQNIYGGGSWFVLEPNNKTVWYVKNNGADGDNWSMNNISTGGAGAIGWKMDDPELHKELESLHEAKENRK